MTYQYDPAGDTTYLETLEAWLNTRLHHGATVTEAKQQLDPHHGHTSGALSVLHQEGKIARLSEKRGGCKVYVHVAYVNGRETEQPGRQRLSTDERLLIDRVRDALVAEETVEDHDVYALVRVVERLA